MFKFDSKPRCVLSNRNRAGLYGKYLFLLNPISAGVLENQDMLGGGQFDPPPLNPMFNVKI